MNWTMVWLFTTLPLMLLAMYLLHEVDKAHAMYNVLADEHAKTWRLLIELKEMVDREIPNARLIRDGDI